MEFYLSHSHSIPGKASSEIIELSQFLNDLRMKSEGSVPDKFRNPNGVYMKLMNLRRFDPDYSGKGLERGGKDESAVWELYASNKDELTRVSDAIRDLVSLNDTLPQIEGILPDEQEAEEGRVLTRLHRFRERDPAIVGRKKQRTLKEQKALACEGCQFDFEKSYGDRGHGFIECHHTKPLSELSSQGGTTKISDLSLVCSNCHRMIHKSRPWLSIAQLQDLVKQSLAGLQV